MRAVLLLLLLLVAMPASADDLFLDRAAIQEGVAKIKPKVVACGERANVAGTVKLKVNVAPTGKVTSVTISDTPDAKLGDCVAAAMRAAAFAPSQSGGAFGYPFVFDGKPPAEAPELDRATVQDGVTKVRTKIAACQTTASGTVRIKAEVTPAGSVKSVLVVETPEQELGTCVATAFKTATFRPTRTGGSFSYPFVFDAKPAGVELDRVGIQDGIAKVRPRIIACGDTSKARGTVKVTVVVAPAGRVTSAMITGTPDPTLGDCVAAVIKTATFVATKTGGSFSYPFVFDTKPVDVELDALDRSAIQEGVAKVRPKFSECAANAPAGGTVKVQVEVAPGGTVKRVTVVATPEKALGDCVAAAFKSATFRATKSGGSFSYPIIFDGKTPPVEAPDDPETIDRATILAAITKVKPQIMACGDRSKARGQVKLRIEVAPAGTVTSSTAVVTPDQALGECVAGVVKQVTFPKTVKGGTFSYPFVF